MPDKNNFEPSAKKPKVEIDLNNLVKQEKDSDVSPGSLEQEQRVQEQLLPTVQLFGTDIPYRRCGKILLFSTAAVVALIRAWLPIAADLQQIINSLQVRMLLQNNYKRNLAKKILTLCVGGDNDFFYEFRIKKLILLDQIN